MTPSGRQERRQDGREDLLLKVEYGNANDLLADYLTDLSQGGIFIRTTAPFEIGSRLAFKLSFPGILAPLDLHGIVRWKREEGPTGSVGVGVEFEFDDDQQRQLISALVGKLRASGRSDKASKGPTGSFRVLLVEDNQFVHDLFRHAIGKLHSSLEIVGVFDGDQAMREIDESEFDLAIVDHFLPGAQGTELVKQIRDDARLREMPVLVVSTGGESIRAQALEAGADLYLDKPVLLKQLLATLELLLSVRGFRP